MEQPIGDFVPCSMCDVQTLLYLMNQLWGPCKIPAFTDPPVPCTTPLVFTQGTYTGTPPTTGPNLTETGFTVVPLVPCYRDWVALGLGNPPAPYVPPSGWPWGWQSGS
jgi:hypothetical protein